MSPDTLFFIAKTLIDALVVAAASSLANRQPVLAGYITALPLVTILALSFAYAQSRDGAEVAKYAVSILISIPITVVFFLPFLLYSRLKGPFWLYILAGVGLLYLGGFVQRFLAARLLS